MDRKTTIQRDNGKNMNLRGAHEIFAEATCEPFANCLKALMERREYLLHPFDLEKMTIKKRTDQRQSNDENQGGQHSKELTNYPH